MLCIIEDYWFRGVGCFVIVGRGWYKIGWYWNIIVWFKIIVVFTVEGYNGSIKINGG
jgi:hypothetical protein